MTCCGLFSLFFPLFYFTFEVLKNKNLWSRQTICLPLLGSTDCLGIPVPWNLGITVQKESVKELPQNGHLIQFLAVHQWTGTCSQNASLRACLLSCRRPRKPFLLGSVHMGKAYWLITLQVGELKKHSSHRVGRRISDLELKTNIITFKINTAVIKKFKNIVFLNSPNSGKTHELFHSFF